MQIEVSKITTTALVGVTTAYGLVHGATDGDVVEWLRAHIHDDAIAENMEIRDLLVEALDLANLRPEDELTMRIALSVINATMAMSLWDVVDLHCSFADANDWPDDYLETLRRERAEAEQIDLDHSSGSEPHS